MTDRAFDDQISAMKKKLATFADFSSKDSEVADSVLKAEAVLINTWPNPNLVTVFPRAVCFCVRFMLESTVRCPMLCSAATRTSQSPLFGGRWGLVNCLRPGQAVEYHRSISA